MPLRRSGLALLPAMLALAACATRPAWRGDEAAAYEILNQSTLALVDVDRRALGGPFGSAVRQACAIFVFAGATTGVPASASTTERGVLLAREPQGRHWAGPAFYRLSVDEPEARHRVRGRVWIVTVGCRSLQRLLAADEGHAGAERDLEESLGQDMQVWTAPDRGVPEASPERVLLRPLPAVALAYYQAPASLQAILVDGSVHNDASAEIQAAIAGFVD